MRKQDIAKGTRHEIKVSVFEVCMKLWRRGEGTNVTKRITN